MLLYLFFGAFLLIALFIVGIFNGLVGKRNTLKNAWSDIDVQLKRRYDLIPNLVEAVKGYMTHEKGVLESVTQARSAALSATTPDSKGKAENMLSGALKSLFAVSEQYPDLKASANFQQLQDQLSSLENDIQSARRYYNAAVREYTNATQTFPSVLFAHMFGFGPEQFFQAEEGERKNVSVKL